MFYSSCQTDIIKIAGKLGQTKYPKLEAVVGCHFERETKPGKQTLTDKLSSAVACAVTAANDDAKPNLLSVINDVRRTAC